MMQFEVRTGQDRRPSPTKMSMSLHEESCIPEQRGEEMFQTKRRLSLTVYTEFWSNNAQLSRKTQQAERMTRAYLFKEMLPLLEEIILESDSHDVAELAGNIKEMMLGTHR